MGNFHEMVQDGGYAELFSFVQDEEESEDNAEIICGVGRGGPQGFQRQRAVPRLPRQATLRRSLKKMEERESGSGPPQNSRGRGRARIISDFKFTSKGPKVGESQVPKQKLIDQEEAVPVRRQFTRQIRLPNKAVQLSEKDFPALGSKESKRTQQLEGRKTSTSSKKTKSVVKDVLNTFSQGASTSDHTAIGQTGEVKFQFDPENNTTTENQPSREITSRCDNLNSNRNSNTGSQTSLQSVSIYNQTFQPPYNLSNVTACESDVDTGRTFVPRNSQRAADISNNATLLSKMDVEFEFSLLQKQKAAISCRVARVKKPNPYEHLEVTLEDIEKFKKSKAVENFVVEDLSEDSVEINTTDMNTSKSLCSYNTPQTYSSSNEVYMSSKSNASAIVEVKQTDSTDKELKEPVNSSKEKSTNNSQCCTQPVQAEGEASEENQSKESRSDSVVSGQACPEDTGQCSEDTGQCPDADGQEVEEDVWTLSGDCVLQVDNIPVSADLSRLIELVADIGEVVDQEFKVHDTSISVRFQMNEESICQLTVIHLQDIANFLPDCSHTVCYRPYTPESTNITID